MAVCLGGLTEAYASLTLSLQTMLVLGVIGILLFAFTVPDSTSFWDGFLTDFIDQMASFGVDMAQPDVFLSLAALALLLFAGVGFVDNWYGLRRTSSGHR